MYCENVVGLNQLCRYSMNLTGGNHEDVMKALSAFFSALHVYVVLTQYTTDKRTQERTHDGWLDILCRVLNVFEHSCLRTKYIITQYHATTNLMLLFKSISQAGYIYVLIKLELLPSSLLFNPSSTLKDRYIHSAASGFSVRQRYWIYTYMCFVSLHSTSCCY